MSARSTHTLADADALTAATIQVLIRNGQPVDLARLKDPDVPLPDLAIASGQ